MSDTITVTGNVATDPEHRRTPSGVAITTFRVASGQRRYDRARGQWVETGTNWYSVSTFRGLADHAFHSLRKGDRVILTGRLRVRTWESGGKQGTAVEVDAEAIGHDLLWGTTSFSKDAPIADVAVGEARETWSTAQPSESADVWSADANEGGWAVPGAAAGPQAEPALELVGADTPY